MKSILIGLYILLTEFVYLAVLFLLSYFFVKFFWNKEKVNKNGKIKIIVKEKPIKKRVFTVLGCLVVILLFADILSAVSDIDIAAATRIYPFKLSENNKEGIYPRFLYNMQVSKNEAAEKEVKFNLLFFYNYNEVEKTIARDNLKQNKVTYFDEVENTIPENNVENSVIENIIENVIYENSVANEVNSKKVSNTSK